ncbi:unnamed protein product (macronuclear) [Paramecium tetraurelia]|uniref:CRC domain-containing protein n=1 Tax=Paramecium tetraurelia TaxID=5888 RepID=A0DUS8_PARTE|nr:uncharacterized protein GSPATT00039783001 [Paramecium tetraurelia]CAK86795.1 unnamed protein product [Paramecium tetraurelia]|eukprot:XP_001454192.1 hypothetical protein (macronuclear) [Paramecium tetraurelia strain d4-2]
MYKYLWVIICGIIYQQFLTNYKQFKFQNQMKTFQISKDSSFRILVPQNRIEMEEETVETSIQLVFKEYLSTNQDYYFLLQISQKSLQIQSKLFINERSCNCKKSQCLKQYCDCFANGQMCSENCNCVGCFNNTLNMEQRKEAKVQIINRDPGAFKQSFKGCNCKKSGCQKKYCECFLSGLACTHLCRCDGCLNCSK